jgi:hypothetical protein
MSLATNLFDTRYLYERSISADSPTNYYLEGLETNEIEFKTNEKIMCRNMIRKDFELIRIQDSFLKLFNDVEFFSDQNDDLLSIDHVAQIAFKKINYEFTQDLYDFIRDFGCQLAFNYKNGEKSELENIKENSIVFVNLIFESSTFDCQKQAMRYFLKRMIKGFPHFNLIQAKRYLKELNIELKKEQ